MPRVIGIDPGTVTVDICGLDDGAVFLDRSLPTADALGDPPATLDVLDAAHRAAPLDLVAGPSGYGLPLIRAQQLTDNDLRLAYLAPEGEAGGIGGLRTLMRSRGAGPAPAARRSPSRADASSTGLAAPRALSGCARPARSTARSRISPGRSRSV